MTKSKEIVRLKERVLELEVALAKQMPKAAPSDAPWRERWFGSGGKEGYEGWSIVGDRELIAYLGREVSSEAVSAIVMAHNVTLAEPTTKAESAHPDDIAVDALATAMKFKLAKQRSKGYGGWDTDCTQQRLSDMLRAHVAKGDPVDVANFCAFLVARGEGIQAEVQPKTAELPKGVAQFTKKPVTINAIQWDGKNLYEVISFTQGVPNTRSERAQDAWDNYAKIVEREGLHIDTLEGKMLANVGDWIIRGVKGEHYPCKPDIFAATYETATAPQAQSADALDAAFEAVRKKLCKLPKFSFVIDRQYGHVTRKQDDCGRWIEFDEVHELFDPVAVDAAIAAQTTQGEKP